MKKVIKKNQVIITSLAILIAVLRERHKLLQEVEIREHKNRGDKP